MRRHPRRFFLAGLVVIAIVFTGSATAVFSSSLYDAFVRVRADCGGNRTSTPASFGAWIDTTPYLMPYFVHVTFPSRDPEIEIDAWWVPGPTTDAPAVILAHGSGDCKRGSNVLLPAGMLHRHGYAVLLIDLRNEGESTITDGRIAGGAGEARDILGAWDWVRREKGLAASRIGLYGQSLGAGAVIIASGDEPGVAAVWEDSGYADLAEIFKHWARALWLPWPIGDLTVQVGRLRNDGILTRPIDSLDRIAGRPMAIIAGENDASVPADNARQLAASAQAHGSRTLVWIVPGAGHVGALSAQPAEYERRLLAFFDGALGGTGPAPGA